MRSSRIRVTREVGPAEARLADFAWFDAIYASKHTRNCRTPVEVQTPSDTTYRFCDWSQEYGRAARELHVEAALEVVSGTWSLNVDHRRSVHRVAGEKGELLATDVYRVCRVGLSAGAVWRSVPGVAWVAYVEAGRVRSDGSARGLRRGGCVLLPAAWEGEMVAEVPTRVIGVVVGAG